MKFMHIADVHLGCAPDAGSPWSERRRDEIWNTFRSVVYDAGREQADLLLIAGDLFHRQPLPQEIREVNYLLGSLSGTRVVLMAGNHDYLSPASPYREFPWAPNVVFLSSGECECVRFPEIDTEVYGLSYDRQEIREPLYDRVHPVKNGFFHILLAHGGDDQHIPFSREAMAASGFDYIALGHIHRPQTMVRGLAAYSGALEPIDSADYGRHGYILGEFDGKHVRFHFVEKATRQYRRVTLKCTPEDTTYSIKDRLEAVIREQGEQHIYRVVLEGSRDPGMRYELGRLTDFGLVLDVTDHTDSVYAMEELKQRYRGGLIEKYIESFEGQDLGETQKKALQYGLDALLEARKD